MSTILSLLGPRRVLPVVTIRRAGDAPALCQALLEGGLDMIEITLRTPEALAAIAAARTAAPGMVVGAGTVRSARDVADATAAGAQFLVTPGATPALLDALAGAAVPALPGAATVSEAMRLAEAGHQAAKLFPAEAAGGVETLKAIAAPLPELKFCPTGGIGPEQAPRYLALANVACVGGSWMAPMEAIARQDWGAIRDLARAAARL